MPKKKEYELKIDLTGVKWRRKWWAAVAAWTLVFYIATGVGVSEGREIFWTFTLWAGGAILFFTGLDRICECTWYKD